MTFYVRVTQSITELEKARRTPVWDFFAWLRAITELERSEKEFTAALFGRELK